MGKDPRALAQSSPKDEGAAISAQLNELITRCTAFDENQRPQSFQEILTTLGERTSMPAEFVIAKNVVQILASEVSEKKKTQSESQETDTKDPGDTAEELGSVISLHVREREQIEVKSQS
jgi:hypothetical protein